MLGPGRGAEGAAGAEGAELPAAPRSSPAPPRRRGPSSGEGRSRPGPAPRSEPGSPEAARRGHGGCGAAAAPRPPPPPLPRRRRAAPAAGLRRAALQLLPAGKRRGNGAQPGGNPGRGAGTGGDGTGGEGSWGAREECRGLRAACALGQREEPGVRWVGSVPGSCLPSRGALPHGVSCAFPPPLPTCDTLLQPFPVRVSYPLSALSACPKFGCIFMLLFFTRPPRCCFRSYLKTPRESAPLLRLDFRPAVVKSPGARP